MLITESRAIKVQADFKATAHSITGADSGIGRAVALAFAREGADVAISYLSEEKDARDRTTRNRSRAQGGLAPRRHWRAFRIQSRCPESHRCVRHCRHP